MSSLRITMRRPSATIPPLPSCGESSIEKITRYNPNSVLTNTMRKTASAAARTRGESTRLLHSHDLVAQAETHQLLTFCLCFSGRGEVAVAQREHDRLARLGGDAHLVAGRTKLLGRLHGAAQRERQADLHAQGLALPDHERLGKSLLAERGDESLGLTRRRNLLDQ